MCSTLAKSLATGEGANEPLLDNAGDCAATFSPTKF
jgi:hypothetical protein